MGMPDNRSALATAPGHSIHGSTWASARMSRTRLPTTSNAPVVGVLVHYPFGSILVHVGIAEMGIEAVRLPGPAGASTSSRRRRRMAWGGSGGIVCQASGSSSTASEGADGPNDTGISPVERTVTIMVPSWTHPAQMSSWDAIIRARSDVLPTSPSGRRRGGSSAPARCAE